MANIDLKENTKDMFGPLTFEDANYPQLVEDINTKCFLCDKEFNLKSQLDLFCKHIFEEHNIVIEDVQNIENLHEYVNYWANKFRTRNFEEIVPSIEINAVQGKYFVLSTLLKEDKVLRHKLKLDYAMRVQEFERIDKTYTRQCLFCRLNFEGTRPDYLLHLSEKHNLHLGNPQNLVFIEELIEIIDTKLKNLLCIFCEKTFTDRNTLKEHMRKKLHKRINPDNKEYDKYYIVNYLEAGKNWRVIEKENDRYAVPVGYEQNSDEEYSDWLEKEDEINCLFCSTKDRNINTLCLHMDADHNFDFVELTKNLDFYQKIKLVNYIRRQIHNKKCSYCNESFGNLQEHMLQTDHYKLPDLKIFDQPEFYFPTYENDAFLYFIDDVEED